MNFHLSIFETQFINSGRTGGRNLVVTRCTDERHRHTNTHTPTHKEKESNLVRIFKHFTFILHFVSSLFFFLDTIFYSWSHTTQTLHHCAVIKHLTQINPFAPASSLASKQYCPLIHNFWAKCNLIYQTTIFLFSAPSEAYVWAKVNCNKITNSLAK